MWTRTELTRSRATGAAVAALAIVGVLVALPGLARGAATATSTRLTIEPREGYFFGYVHSRNSACEVGRKVTLYAVTGATRYLSRDRKIGTDFAQPNGPDSMWSITTEEGGRFYAHVRATATCKAAFSPIVTAEL